MHLLQNVCFIYFHHILIIFRCLFLNPKQIEDYLDKINDGELSEDGLEESDGEDESFYVNREDFLEDELSPLPEKFLWNKDAKVPMEQRLSIDEMM